MSKRKHFFILVKFLFLLLIWESTSYGQNSGIGTTAPTHTLHIRAKSSNSEKNPLRIEGLQDFISSRDSFLLIVDPDSGVVRQIRMDSLRTRFQDYQSIDVFSISGTTLSLSLENDQEVAQTVDLSPLQDGTGTDDQTLTLSGNTLSIEDGNSVSLSAFLDNTDAQDLSLNANTLSLTGDASAVDLSGYLDNTDDQAIDAFSFSGTTLSLSIEGDGEATQTVDLSSLQDGTGSDDQTIDVFSLSDNTLSLSLENDGEANQTVDLGGLSDNLGDHIATENIQLGNYYLSGDGDDEGISVDGEGEVGIGTNSPGGPLHIYEATRTSTNASSGSLILEHGNSGGESSILFKSKVNSGSDYGFITFQDDGSGNGSSTENAILKIGIQNDGSGAYQDDIALLPSGNVGVGTTSPAAKLEVDGGTVRFSDYGTGANTGTETFMLGVDTDGDVVEMNTVKASKVLYPPALVIDASSTGTGLTLDLHQQYQNYFSSPSVASSGAPSSIPYYSESELYYYVTNYDNTVFANVSIAATGIMTYDIIAVPSDNCSVINVVFVVK